MLRRYGPRHVSRLQGGPPYLAARETMFAGDIAVTFSWLIAAKNGETSARRRSFAVGLHLF
jgi:hypothetical protein